MEKTCFLLQSSTRTHIQTHKHTEDRRKTEMELCMWVWGDIFEIVLENEGEELAL